VNETPVPNRISVTVTTYNREDAPDACGGTTRPSRRSLRTTDPCRRLPLVESWRSSLSRPFVHVWHEDCEFRAAEICDRAVLESFLIKVRNYQYETAVGHEAVEAAAPRSHRTMTRLL
jgi:hypothetical protein